MSILVIWGNGFSPLIYEEPKKVRLPNHQTMITRMPLMRVRKILKKAARIRMKTQNLTLPNGLPANNLVQKDFGVLSLLFPKVSFHTVQNFV